MIDEAQAQALDQKVQELLDEEERFETHHGDPNADLILKSRTARTYKVQSHYLISKSAMISDMFSAASVAKKRKLDSGEPSIVLSDSPNPDIPTIELDCSSRVLVHYIAIMQTPKPIMNFTLMKAFGLNFDQLLALQGVCRMMPVTEWDEEISELLMSKAREEPWKAFRHAAAAGLPQLAERAIRNFDRDEKSPPMLYPKIKMKDFRGIPELWTFELFRLHKECGGGKKAWRKVAPQFVKAVEETEDKENEGEGSEASDTESDPSN